MENLETKIEKTKSKTSILKGKTKVLRNEIDKSKAFEVKGLNLHYNFGKASEKQALQSIDLEIEKNKVTALIGPSGCGKSTFLRCLNRMNDLIDGCHVECKCYFEGQDIYHKEQDIIDLRRRVGMVFQKPNPFPMTIFDNIAYGPRCQGVKDKAKLAELVEKSLKDAALWDEVKDRLKDSALGLSGGQQQRLCIARTIAMEPEVILMDEPTSALDPIATAKIEELMEDLKKKFTIVIVTHSMQQAARISDRTAFFWMGEIIEVGKTKQIFTNPKHEKTEQYITGRFG